MSFRIDVTVTEGEASVTVSGPVPDGKYSISGHDDENRRDSAVTVYGVDGSLKSIASTSNYKEV